MTKPHLDTADVDAAPDEPRSACVSKHVWNNVAVGCQPNFQFGLVPDGTELLLIDTDEWTDLLWSSSNRSHGTRS